MNFIEIFLIANAFLVGVVVTLAVHYGLAHRRSKQTVKPQNAPVPAAVRERIAKQAEENMQTIVDRTATQLERDLVGTSTQLNKLLQKFGTEVLDDEMRLFRANVAEIRSDTQGSLAGAQGQIAEQEKLILEALAQRQTEMDARLAARQAELEAGLEQRYALQQEAITKQLNDKMNDAVLAFLLETLGHEVDLGAQADYLVKTLEANKAALLDSAVGKTVEAKK